MIAPKGRLAADQPSRDSLRRHRRRTHRPQRQHRDGRRTWNYTTRLNIAFLVLAALFVWRFCTTGGRARLAEMGGGPDEMSTHEIGGSAVSIDLARAGGLGTITNSPFPSNRVTANV
jgi:hypothetical protein